MLLLVLLLAPFFVAGVLGQAADGPQLDFGNVSFTGGYEIEAESINGTCSCVVTAPEYSHGDVHLQIIALQDQVSLLHGDIAVQLDIVMGQAGLLRNLSETMTNLGVRYDTLVDRMQFAVFRTLYEEVLDEIEIISDLVGRLDDNGTLVRQIRDELTNLTSLVDTYHELTINTILELQARVAELKAAVLDCDTDEGSEAIPPTTGSPEQPAWPLQCPDGHISAVHEPVTSRHISGTSSVTGSWMTDINPPPGQEGYYYYTVGYSNPKIVKRFNNLDDFLGNVRPTTISTRLGWSGTSHVILSGYIYYVKYNTATLVKENLGNGTDIATIGLPATSGYQATYAYSGGLYSSIDLAVDELGLWVIFATGANAGNIVIGRVDPDTLDIEMTWATNRLKGEVGEAFMVCGRMYTVDSHDTRLNRLYYYYDTADGSDGYDTVPLLIKYGKLTSLDYNPRERVLYAWDNGHLVTYGLEFSP